MNRYFEDTLYYLRRAGASIRKGVRYEIDGLRGRARDDVAERRARAAEGSRVYVDRARGRISRGRRDEEEVKSVA